MKDKIFQRLKTSYSSLGLGDAILQAHAEALANLGLVTDDNIETVITAQKGFLESLQQSNDKRVTEAVAKAKKAAEDDAAAKKAAEEAAKKAAEEEAAKKAAEEEARKKAAEEPEWFKAYKEQVEKERKAESEKFNAFKTEYDKLKAEQAKSERQNMILAKAKELGIPQSRIDEGFAIAETENEEGIANYLANVAKNINAYQLPNKPFSFPHSDGNATKEEVDKVAAMLVK